MKSKEEVLEFVRHLQHLYWEERNMKALLRFLAHNIFWIGTGEAEVCCGLSEAERELEKQVEECPFSFILNEEKYSFFPVTDGTYSVYGEFSALSTKKEIADFHGRFTAICREQEDGLKLVHLHMSQPVQEQMKGSYYVRREALRANEALTASVPGGLYCCMNNAELTLLTMNDSFLNIVGYTQEEIAKLFDNSLMQIVYEEDREYVRREIERQSKKGKHLDVSYRVARKDGTRCWVLDKGVRVREQDGAEVFYCVLLDVTVQKRESDILMAQASLDSLTGLLNKRISRERIEAYLRDENRSCGTLLLLDLDDFKGINDWYGHLCGDRVLTEIADIMKTQFRGCDVTSRVGGDEFLIYLPEVTYQGAVKAAGRLLEAIRKIQIGGNAGLVRASVGASFYPEDGQDYVTLFSKADQALYHVKKNTKNACTTYASLEENLRIPEYRKVVGMSGEYEWGAE